MCHVLIFYIKARFLKISSLRSPTVKEFVHFHNFADLFDLRNILFSPRNICQNPKKLPFVKHLSVNIAIYPF